MNNQGEINYSGGIIKNQHHSFALSERLGGGGFGVVYRAGLDAAIKIDLEIIKEADEASADFVERQSALQQRQKEFLQKEADYHSQFEHPHIPTFIAQGVGSLVLKQSGLVIPNKHFIAMEYLNRGSLDERRLSPKETIRAMGHLTKAIGYIHEQDLIHADVKPANILADHGRKGMVYKLGDFGNIQPVGTNNGVGTIAWASPDQAGRRPLQKEDDLYSATLVWGVLLTGVPLQENAHNKRSIEEVVFDARIPMNSYFESIQGVLNKGLHHNPKHRYHSAAELYAAIESAHHEGQVALQRNREVFDLAVSFTALQEKESRPKRDGFTKPFAHETTPLFMTDEIVAFHSFTTRILEDDQLTKKLSDDTLKYTKTFTHQLDVSLELAGRIFDVNDSFLQETLVNSDEEKTQSFRNNFSTRLFAVLETELTADQLTQYLDLPDDKEKFAHWIKENIPMFGLYIKDRFEELLSPPLVVPEADIPTLSDTDTRENVLDNQPAYVDPFPDEPSLVPDEQRFQGFNRRNLLQIGLSLAGGGAIAYYGIDKAIDVFKNPTPEIPSFTDEELRSPNKEQIIIAKNIHELLKKLSWDDAYEVTQVGTAVANIDPEKAKEIAEKLGNKGEHLAAGYIAASIADKDPELAKGLLEDILDNDLESHIEHSIITLVVPRLAHAYPDMAKKFKNQYNDSPENEALFKISLDPNNSRGVIRDLRSLIQSGNLWQAKQASIVVARENPDAMFTLLEEMNFKKLSDNPDDTKAGLQDMVYAAIEQLAINRPRHIKDMLFQLYDLNTYKTIRPTLRMADSAPEISTKLLEKFIKDNISDDSLTVAFAKQVEANLNDDFYRAWYKLKRSPISSLFQEQAIDALKNVKSNDVYQINKVIIALSLSQA